MEIKRYKIGDRGFFQGVPVLVQVRQIGSLVKEQNINFDSFTIEDVINLMLQDHVSSRFMAIVLNEDGVNLKDKNLAELEEFLDYTLDLATATEIVKDFFIINDILSLVSRITGSIDNKLSAQLEQMKPKTEKKIKKVKKHQ